MTIKIPLYIALFLSSVYIMSECKAQNAAHVVFYHQRSRAQLNNQQQENFPLYPVGDEVPNLPAPIPIDATDLKVIQSYYNAVAKAFFTAAEQLEDKANINLEKIKSGQAKVSLAGVRANDKVPLSHSKTGGHRASQIDPHTDKAQRVDIHNKSDIYKNSLKEAEMLRSKGEFYAELADTAQQLNEGIISN
jgi:hypothetical protein